MTICEQLKELESQLEKAIEMGESEDHIMCRAILVGVRAQASQADSLATIAVALRKISEVGLPK